MVFYKKTVSVLMIGCVLVLALLYVNVPWSFRWEKVRLDNLRSNTANNSTSRYHLNDTIKEDEELTELFHMLQTRLESQKSTGSSSRSGGWGDHQPQLSSGEYDLAGYKGPELNYTREMCGKNDDPSRTCYDEACPGHFSPSLRVRLKQVLASRTSIPTPYLQALASAAQAVTSHRYIFVTGASSNHYYEMQASMKSLHTSLFPRMKGEDFILVFYNLGLSDEERRLTEKNCRCTVVDFPFPALPHFIRELKCYAWKTAIIASLLEKAEYLFWLDASIRLRDSDPLPEIFQRARENGYQAHVNSGSIAVRTRETMAHFFGDAHLCQYSPFSEMEATFMVFHNDRFMREAVLKPWLSCAFSRKCMCIPNHASYLACDQKPWERFYGRCHRFDQSGIGMILSKLFLQYRPMLYTPGHKRIVTARGTKMDWFN